MITCEIYRRHVDAVVDGEVDPNTQIELDEHVARCAHCRDHFAFASSFKRQVSEALAEARAPEGLRARLQLALDEEDGRRNAQPPPGPPLGIPGIRLPFVRPRYAVPAAAAAVALAVIAAREGGNPGAEPQQASIAPVGDPQAAAIFEDVIHRHSVEHPAEVQGSEAQVVSWFRGKLGFAVHPIEFDRPDVRLVGARLSSVRDRDAATFYYDVQGRRVTVVVFEPPEPVDRMARHIDVGGRDIYFGQAHGYTVPVVEHDGLTYAIAGNLDSRTLFSLAASAHVSDR